MCIIFITFNVHKLYIQLRCHAGPLANGVESLEVAEKKIPEYIIDTSEETLAKLLGCGCDLLGCGYAV